MYDVVVIGAGVVGCASARELSKYRLKICALEKASDVAEGTSKANSAIVHAGFDAKPNSLKGKLNAKGNAMFDKLSKELDFPFKRIGAMVLCFDEKEIYRLYDLKEQGEMNGVPDLRILEKEELHELEPNLSESAVAALYAPSSGIVCPYEMTIALAENANENGVEFKFQAEVIDIKRFKDIYRVYTNNEMLEARVVINAAGNHADEINNMISENKISIVPRLGEYCLFDKEAGTLVNKTIFQLPTSMGKGVLVTPTIDGNLLLGPNAVEVKDKNSVPTSKSGIDDIIEKGKLSVKNLPLNKIITSFSGLRAHSLGDDFIIGEAEDAENFINAAGIESPGLSSAPAIADVISNIVTKKLAPEVKADYKPVRTSIPKFRELRNEERNKLIKENIQYGKIICRCETVTEGEITAAINRPLGARTLDGVKRRTRAGMGRCQSGFCQSKVLEILARELKVDISDITKFGGNSFILEGKNKDSYK